MIAFHTFIVAYEALGLIAFVRTMAKFRSVSPLSAGTLSPAQRAALHRLRAWEAVPTLLLFGFCLLTGPWILLPGDAR